MNAIKSFFSWIADLFGRLFGKKQDDNAEKPTLCGGPVKKDKEGK